MLEKTLFLIFLYLPFQVALNPTEGFDLASIRVAILIVFLLWLIKGLKEKNIPIPFNRITISIISFLFIAGLSIFWASNANWGIRKMLFLLSIFPLYFIVSSINKKSTITLIKFFIWGGFLASIVGFFQFLLQFIVGINSATSLWGKIITPFLGNSFSNAVLENSSWLVSAGGVTLFRSISFFPDPHMMSFYLNMTAILSLSIYLQNKTKAYFFIFLFISLVSLLSFSRGGYLGLTSGLFFMLILSSKNLFYKIKEDFQKYLSVTMIVISTLFLMFIFSNPISERLSSSFDLEEGSNSERIEIWKNSLQVVSSNIFMGTGLGNYSLHIKLSADYREPIYSHNAYLDIAAEIGMFGLIFWILVLFFSIKDSLKYFREKHNLVYIGLASAAISFSVHSFFETAIYSVHILPSIIMIIAVISSSKNKYENN